MTFIYKGKIGSIFQFVFYMLFFAILILIKNLFIIAFVAILIYIGAITILFVFFIMFVNNKKTVKKIFINYWMYVLIFVIIIYFFLLDIFSTLNFYNEYINPYEIEVIGKYMYYIH